MSKRPKPKPGDPEQSKGFIKPAEEAEADDAKALDSAFKKIITKKSDAKRAVKR